MCVFVCVCVHRRSSPLLNITREGGGREVVVEGWAGSVGEAVLGSVVLAVWWEKERWWGRAFVLNTWTWWWW